MASYIKRGEKILIPFRNGISIGDSQCRPRMYKTMAAFRKSFPGYHLGTEYVELVEYAEVVHGRWKQAKYTEAPLYICSECDKFEYKQHRFCPNCGAKMDGGDADVKL